MRVSRLLKAAFIAASLSMLFANSAFSQQGRVFGIGEPAAARELPAGQFKDALLALPSQARGRALGILRGTTTPEQDFVDMRVDENGFIYYVDPVIELGEENAGEPELPEGITEANVFTLHSKPGASSVLYIDFDGHDLIGTRWNVYSGQSTLNMRRFDLDGNDTNFSTAEVTRIAETWRRVAEDFAPFDIDVTTEEPPFTVNPTSGRIEYASNVGHNLVTQQQDANGYWVYTQGGCGCGGVAYLGVFGNRYYQPGLTFNRSLSSNALTVSHETGHNLNLSHDGTSTSGYYSGHGSGATSWGPIMGAPFGDSLTQWSKDEYPDANNPQDDFAVINNYLAFRTDDHEDANLGFATPLMVTGGINVLSDARVDDPAWASLANKGIIEDANDIDLFTMYIGEGQIALNIDPARLETYQGIQGVNLDLEVALLDALGNELQISNPDLEPDATINYTVTVAGTYYLRITGVGRAGTGGNDYGHSEYGSVGQYYINGTIPEDIVITGSPSAAENLLAVIDGDANIHLSWFDPLSPPETNESGYQVFRSVNGGGFGLRATLARDSEFFPDNNLTNGDYRYFVRTFNSQGEADTGATTPINIDIPTVAVATTEGTAMGAIQSGSYASTQVVTGTETLVERHSGGRPSNRRSQLDHTWTVTGVAPGSTVDLEVRASAPANDEADEFAFTYAINGGAAIALGVVVPGTGELTMTASLPSSTTGNVQIRVVDTNRTQGWSDADTVTVSLIEITAAGDPGQQAPMVTILSPADGTTVTSADLVTFEGIADDFEDGDISNSITWASDHDDSLGSGASAVTTLSGDPLGPRVHTITATIVDSAGQSDVMAIEVTVDDTPPPATVHIGDIDGATTNKKGNKWQAEVTFAVHDSGDGPAANVTVSGNWSNGASGSGSCSTGGPNTCTVTKGGLKGNVSSVTFTVTSVTGAPYDGGVNHDPEGDSDGTVIVVNH